MHILEVRDLRVYYKSILGDYKAVDGVSFQVNRNEIFSIAGESGCGKSSLVDGILRLVKPPGYIVGGEVIFEGKNILEMPEKELQKIRFVKIAYVPQGAMNSLNPVLKIKEQVIDAILDHTNLSEDEAVELAASKLKEVGLPEEVMNMYPHELSGGMKQRVIIASALALNPQVIVADEPTTALDVVVQKGILQLLRDLKEKYQLTILLVSHDMAVHAQVADRMSIMYAGKIVEIGPIRDIYKDPLHPYTKALLASIPRRGMKNIKGIPGIAPSPLKWPKGCRFHPRCPLASEKCKKIEPPMKRINSERYVSCILYE